MSLVLLVFAAVCETLAALSYPFFPDNRYGGALIPAGLAFYFFSYGYCYSHLDSSYYAY